MTENELKCNCNKDTLHLNRFKFEHDRLELNCYCKTCNKERGKIRRQLLSYRIQMRELTRKWRIKNFNYFKDYYLSKLTKKKKRI